MLLIGLLLLINVRKGLFLEGTYGPGAPEPPLYGIWDVERFTLDGEDLPPLLTDDRRWRNVAFDRRRQLAVRRMDGEVEFHTYAIEGAQRLSIYLDREGDSTWIRSPWTFVRPSPGDLHMDGELDGRAISLELTARDPRDLPLLRRGFHWINEVPMSRPLPQS